MQISIIIPTYNRPKKILKTLESILIQTHLPSEIIVVDDSDNVKTKNLCNIIKNKFIKKGISIIYIQKKKNKSAAISRNIGAYYAKENIILFLDDDIILKKDYIINILKVYNKNKNVIGVQGYIINLLKMSNIENAYNKIFYLVHYKKNINKFLPSFQNIYARPLTKIIKCQWLSSSNSSFKKNIFIKYQFDQKLLHYSSGEDADLTYRIFNDYKNGLYQTPFAKLTHNYKQNKIKNKITTYANQIYHTYLFFKIINTNFKNLLIFIWSRIGILLTHIFTIFINPSKALELYYLVCAYVICVINLKSIIKGDLNFFYQKYEFK